MEGNDLGVYVVAHTSVMFEGVIATEPKRRLFDGLRSRSVETAESWSKYLPKWEWHETTLLSINRLAYQYNHGIEVVTLLPEEAYAPMMERFTLLNSRILSVSNFPSMSDLVVAMRMGGVDRVWDSDTERLQALGWMGVRCRPGAEINLG